MAEVASENQSELSEDTLHHAMMRNLSLWKSHSDDPSSEREVYKPERYYKTAKDAKWPPADYTPPEKPGNSWAEITKAASERMCDNKGLQSESDDHSEEEYC